jgi:hypothetical protein
MGILDWTAALIDSAITLVESGDGIDIVVMKVQGDGKIARPCAA